MKAVTIWRWSESTALRAHQSRGERSGRIWLITTSWSGSRERPWISLFSISELFSRIYRECLHNFDDRWWQRPGAHSLFSIFALFQFSRIFALFWWEQRAEGPSTFSAVHLICFYYQAPRTLNVFSSISPELNLQSFFSPLSFWFSFLSLSLIKSREISSEEKWYFVHHLYQHHTRG